MLGDHGKGSIKPVADHELPNRYFCGCRSVLSPVCGSCGERHSTHPDATHSLPPSRMNSTLVAGFMSVRAHRWQTRHPARQEMTYADAAVRRAEDAVVRFQEHLSGLPLVGSTASSRVSR